MTPKDRLGQLGIAVPEVLIPGAGTAPERWSVIACDQFSSERSYWEETRRIVGSDPSALDLIIPECYLEDGDREERADSANAAMKSILEKGLLTALPPGFILVHRSTLHTPKRRGLVMAIDLETYDFAEGSTSSIRPTEGTIRDRLPPRMAVRRGASLDLPHILLLIDDPDDLVMRSATEADGRTVYDFDLMQKGGHVTGRFIPEDDMVPLAEAFETLSKRSDLLFAVGDGNHSLASAREIWLEKKGEGAPKNHPSRFALVEVENIHDEGLHFHPIHRVLFGVDSEVLTADLERILNPEDKQDGLDITTGMIGLIHPDGSTEGWKLPLPAGSLAVEPLQEALDGWIADHPDSDIDYIHGDDAVRELVAGAPDRLGIILPDLDKTAFFRRIIDVGPYPRKTFSIGEAVEKRYYLEARKLVE
jgi:hypothetical protein